MNADEKRTARVLMSIGFHARFSRAMFQTVHGYRFCNQDFGVCDERTS